MVIAPLFCSAARRMAFTGLAEMAKDWRKLKLIAVALLLVSIGGTSAYAYAPGHPNPTAIESRTIPPGTTAERGETVAETTFEPEETLARTVMLLVSSQATSVPSAPATPIPGNRSLPTPAVPFVTPALPSTAHIAVLVGEAVIPISGTAISEVFVSLKDVEPGVLALDLQISFDSEIVQVVDEDKDPTNGVQIAISAFFPGSQRTDLNQVDNRTGRISLSLSQQQGDPIQRTETWRKVGAIAWVAKKEGKSIAAIGSMTRFMTADGQLLVPDETNDGVVFSRAPGRIEGTIKLQGQKSYGDVLVSASLARASVDKGQTDGRGRFAIATSHGEGFYTLEATAPGYLSAESDRPIKVTVDTVAHIGQVTLLGGDVNNDNCVDIRDLSYVAWHFEEYDAKADINGDGQVDILDLSLTAGNFDRCGPTTWVVSDG